MKGRKEELEELACSMVGNWNARDEYELPMVMISVSTSETDIGRALRGPAHHLRGRARLGIVASR